MSSFPRIASPGFFKLERDLCRLLTDLDTAIEDNEVEAEILLKGFDLSLHDCDPIQLSTVPENIPTAAELSQDSLADFLPSSSQNPFLSTPLRLKHFSRLSPSILRGLLRSPSLRSPSLGDGSLDSSVSRACSTADFDDPLQSRQSSLPLTPPPSGRIASFPELPHPDVVPCYDFASAVPMPGNLTTALPNSLVSPTAVRNFRRVIDEMKGVDSAHQSSRVQDDKNTICPLSSPLSNPAGRFSTPEVETHDPSPPTYVSWSIDRPLGALEDEFVSLLQQRAREEEEDAKELRALADRLERIGKGRRCLAALIAERRNER